MLQHFSLRGEVIKPRNGVADAALALALRERNQLLQPVSSLGHILNQSEMLMEVFCLHGKRVSLVARCVTNLGRNETFMQFNIANWQKTHDLLRVDGLGHDTNALTRGESARAAERDGRAKKILNLRVTAISDLPNLTFTRTR